MTTAIAETPKKLTPAPPVPADAGSPTVNIAVSRIVPSPWNRKADVDDLVESVRKNGVVQNVVLRPHKATEEDVALYSMKTDPFLVGESIFQLVAGERRWGAAKKAGRSHIPAAVRHLSDIEAMDFQIDENENRKNLRPMERAEAYDRLRMLYQEAHAKEKDYTEAKAVEAVAASRNCSSRTVYDVISLKKLTPNAQHALRNGEMETSHGVVLAGRSAEEQDKLLLWIRQQTHHSQGDVPSVRRLKLEIRQLDIAAEDRKRQEKLFKEPQSGTSSTPVPTVNDQLYAKAVEVVREAKSHRMNDPLFLERNLKIEPAAAHQLFVRLEKEGIVTPRDSHSERSYIFTKPPAQTTAPSSAEKKTEEAIAKYKPPTRAQLQAAEQQRQKEAKAAEERRKREAKAQRDQERNERIDKRYDAALFTALATKAHVCSRMLTPIVPHLIYEVWDNLLPIETFAQTVLGWPAPKDGHAYSYNEVRAHCVKHTRKFGAKGVLPALLITLYQNPQDAERLSKYFGVDPKKLRKQAAAEVKEDHKARLPKEPETKKEKQLNAIVKGDDPVWDRLRRTGASDVELRKVLCQQLPNDGGHGSKELGNVYARSGNDKPRVWFNSGYPRKKPPSLQGLELIAAVRDLLKIPEKGEVDA